MATYSNIYIDQGATYSSVIDVKDSNELPFNLTGYEARGQIRKSYSSRTAINFTTSINLPTQGKVGISLTAAQTRAIKAGRYLYDVEVYNSSGHVIRICEGQVEISPGISDDNGGIDLPPAQSLFEIIDTRIDTRTAVVDKLLPLTAEKEEKFYLNTKLGEKLSLKAPLESPTFTGTVSGITKGMVGLGLVDNTSDINKPLSSAMITALSEKVDKISGKSLSDENYTLVEKNKLAGIEEGAEVNVNADWNATAGDAQILNKPTTLAGYGITDAVSDSQFQDHLDDISNPHSVTASQVGLGSVNNTSDLDKPISTATQDALDDKVDKVSGKSLSDENYTLVEKNKLAGIAEGAEVNVNADWNVTTGDAQILNKPTTLAGYGITDAVSDSQFQDHLDDDSNPHSVTADQVGLGAVDNTSDADKPISTATQDALDNKVDKVSGQGLSDNNYTLVEKNKLAGIEANATKNSTDAHLLNRTNHTGTQSHTTISGLGTLATQNGTFSGSSSGTNTGDQTITLGGDVTGSGTGPIYVTLASTGVLAGEYNADPSVVTPFTVDIKGRITSVGTPLSLSPDWNNITSTPTTLNGYSITDAVNTFSNQTINGIKEFEESPIVPLIPTASNRAVSKSYVDSIAEGLHIHESVHVILNDSLETASGGSVVYSNGIDGVGAKLTLSGGVGVITTLNSACGTDPDLTYGANGSRVIINGQHSNPHWNGIYFISGEYELTRTLDFDSPVEMAGGDFVFVTHGTTYADTGWVLSEAVTQVGFSPVSFVQFSGAGAYDAGDGLLRDGTLFSVVAGDGITVNGNGVSLTAIATPDTYRSVTVDMYGRVSSGTNPTTLAGYGITDAVSDTQLSNHLNDSSNPHAVTASQVGLGSVNNTSDIDKPISTATQNALNNKVDKITGKSLSDENYSLLEKNKLAGIEEGAEVNVNADWNASSGDAEILNKPTTFPPSSHTHAIADTTGLQTALDSKVDKITGKSLSDENYSLSEKNKLAGIEEGAEVNVNADWNATQGDSQILNKPTTFPPSSHTHAIADTTGLQTALDSKVDKITGKSLSDENYSLLEKNKLAAIAEGAEVNVNADWNATIGDSAILNKPETFPPSSHTHAIADTTGLQTALDSKVDKITGKSLSDENYTLVEKNKLAGIAEGAEVNVNADWNASSGDAEILNKPTTLAGYGITDAVSDTQFNNHLDDDSNPHSVTADQVGLGLVNNTSDLDKPISTATQNALNGKVDKVDGKELSDTNYTLLEKNKLAGIESGAEVNVKADWNASSGDAQILNKPEIFPPSSHTHAIADTTGLQTALDSKVDKITGKSLSDENYTLVEKNKLAGIESGAEVNVKADWNETSTTSDAFIQNKPTTFPPSSHTHAIADTTGLQTALDSKVDKVSGKSLSDENYSLLEKNKLAGIESGAEVNVNADWNATQGDSQILNKPETFPPSSHTHAIADTTGLQTALNSKLNKVTTIDLSITGSGRSFVNADDGKIFHINATSQIDVNLPDYSAVDDGWNIGIVNTGGTIITINRVGSNNVNGKSFVFNSTKYTAVYIYKSATTNEFIALGVLY